MKSNCVAQRPNKGKGLIELLVRGRQVVLEAVRSCQDVSGCDDAASALMLVADVREKKTERSHPRHLSDFGIDHIILAEGFVVDGQLSTGYLGLL